MAVPPSANHTVAEAERRCSRGSAPTARATLMVRVYGFEALHVTVRHGDLARSLPWHHYDPFDRLLIVQALDEGLTILTSDRSFEPYRVPVVWMWEIARTLDDAVASL